MAIHCRAEKNRLRGTSMLENILPSVRECLARLLREKKQLKTKVSNKD
jgi:hypothetical protein